MLAISPDTSRSLCKAFFGSVLDWPDTEARCLIDELAMLILVSLLQSTSQDMVIVNRKVNRQRKVICVTMEKEEGERD